ncbi:hypothetical protein LguiB_005857 [Lonicera macranthoides]
MLVHFLWFSLLFFSSQIKGEEKDIDIIKSPPPLPPPPLPPPPILNQIQRSPFKPSVAVIVGIVTTIFSITFLILLYIKHCKRGSFNNNNHHHNNNVYGSSFLAAPGSGGSRKNSGIDRIVIESLPIFKFGSLSGHKDGLECAVCLNKFESAEFLKLLPQCKHAFHVECVDTWLDAHSTCPLCRHRVHPEDIVFIQGDATNILHHHLDETEAKDVNYEKLEMGNIPRRVSARHSSPGEIGRRRSTAYSSTSKANKEGISTRRSLDSIRSLSLPKKKIINFINNNSKSDQEEELLVGARKDGLLLTAEEKQRRLGHRIIVSGAGSDGKPNTDHRWSEVNPSDLLYLRSEMIISDSRRLSGGSSSSRPSDSQTGDGEEGINGGDNKRRCSRSKQKQRNGRSVINSRSVSEITGLRRTRQYNNSICERQEERKAGVLSRWLAWTSDFQSHSRSQHALSRSPSPLPL